jgi:hypothetical protein
MALTAFLEEYNRLSPNEQAQFAEAIRRLLAERLGIFQVTHSEGAHRRRLNRDTTIWLLLLRLIYAEKRERLEVTLTRYPVVAIGAISQRYSEFFPGQTVRKKGSLEDALRTLHDLKLVRAAGGGAPRINDTDNLIELLPTLEAVVPAGEISALAEKLREYDRGKEE